METFSDRPGGVKNPLFPTVFQFTMLLEKRLPHDPSNPSSTTKNIRLVMKVMKHPPPLLCIRAPQNLGACPYGFPMLYRALVILQCFTGCRVIIIPPAFPPTIGADSPDHEADPLTIIQISACAVRGVKPNSSATMLTASDSSRY